MNDTEPVNCLHGLGRAASGIWEWRKALLHIPGPADVFGCREPIKENAKRQGVGIVVQEQKWPAGVPNE